jgi:CHAT domain-containing protein
MRDRDVTQVLAREKNARADDLDRAVIDLLNGEFDRAIAGFQLTSTAEALTDLSAAYLARFESGNDALDLLRAIHAADRGLAIEASSDALRFNRAMALSRLGTRVLATAACRQVEDDGWREEAAVHLRSLQHPSIDDEWKRVLPRVEAPGATPLEIETLSLQFPANARAYAEEQLLPRWASETARGDSAAADRSLAVASAISEALQRRGEQMPADAVTAIRHTPPAQRETLVHGLKAFGVGVVQYNEQNLTSAAIPLTEAAKDLAAVQNPLRYWARFYLAIAASYQHTNRGSVLLQQLLEEVPADRYPTLLGRIEWIAGTNEKVQRESLVQSSVRRYERAAIALRRAGGDAAAAFVSVLLAESYTLLGEHSLSWEQRLGAFRNVPFTETPRRQIAMWTEAKEALVHQGSLYLAGPFVDEAVAAAEAWGKPLGRVVAYHRRAAYRLAIGRRGEALADLRTAHQALAQMEPSSLRNQEGFLAQITEGLSELQTNPARAAQLLQDALDRQGATGKRFDSITYTTALADAQIASGNLSAAMASLERAISIFEAIHTTVEDPVSRMQAFRQAQPAFDRLIDLQTKSLSAVREGAFRLAERSRARVILELRSGDQQPTFVHLADLEHLLARNVALVSYVVLEDRVIAWVVEDGRARQSTLPIPRAELQRKIERFRLELLRGGKIDEIRRAAVPLYDDLIRPLALSPHAGEPLIIIPDRLLARLPFAALFDSASGEYLVQQRAVSIAPSATLLAQEVRSSQTSAESALVLGISRPGQWRGCTLPPLRQAEREAEHVAALYPGASLLRGDNATRENFLQRSLSSDVIHFAGHAIVDLEAPRRSVLLFADPSTSNVAPLSIGEMFAVGLGHTRLVVLAACRTQDSLADDREGLLGLAGAFIAAGVPEVVASPLDVNDDSVSQVMVAFHRHYRLAHSAAAAFRSTVLDLLHSPSEDLRSPAAWGGFTVIQGSLMKGEGKHDFRF